MHETAIPLPCHVFCRRNSPLDRIRRTLPCSARGFYFCGAALLLSSDISPCAAIGFLLAAIFAAGAWLSVGIAASNLERASVPHNLAGTLIESGKLDSETALRWRGQAARRSAASSLGHALRNQSGRGRIVRGVTPVAGGLRLTYYGAESGSGAPRPQRAPETAWKLLCARVRSTILAIPAVLIRAAFSLPRTFNCRAPCAMASFSRLSAIRDLTLSDRFARLRGRFLGSLNELFTSHPEEGALARAMLLGDRSFVERDRVVDYQKTGVYHVMVLAGLHVGALAAFFLWAGRRNAPWPFPANSSDASCACGLRSALSRIARRSCAPF